ncbi:hypothetical protein J2X69_002985 [Algoriphagus sp. 4150]|uniref:hypothetical protein n=1 Tax=Algoriphagus sp. 4150 TaxID=2817756 RepID=UPI0028551262|nr:hypothetical protein [Algoriphagus sp. 4150]MDR7130629.1 hypothetical protein [Algoriphagus sp. 4150]
MANQFFEIIDDEFGQVWGYNFKPKVLYNAFAASGEKYQDLDLSKPITFTKREFTKKEFDAVFDSPVFNDDNIGERVKIIFKDCGFRIQEAVSFSNVAIEFKNCNSHTGSFVFSKCTDSEIEITNRTVFGLISMIESNDVHLKLKDVIVRELKLRKVKELNFEAERVSEPKIAVDRCLIKEFKIYGSKIKDLQFENSEGDSITLSGVTGGEVSLFKIHEVKGIGNKKSFRYKTLHILSCSFIKLHLTFYQFDVFIDRIFISETSNLSLASIKTELLSVSGTSLSNLLIFSCDIQNLHFGYFKIKENVVFNLGNYGNGTISFDNALLKGVEVNPSFLDRFENISYKHSSIEGLIAHSFKLIKSKVIKEMNVSYENKIGFCRELNALMIVQNNKHYATVYRALELELRAKSNDTSMDWYDKVVLKLNYWSNDNGTKPQKALSMMLIMIVVMFGVINLDLACQTNLPYETGFDFLSQNYSYFIKPFTFLSDVEGSYNPFHCENMQAGFHPITKGFDFLFKIFYAYLLYQFIAAFRKFNK